MRAGRREAVRLMEKGQTQKARFRSEGWVVVIAEEVKDQRGQEFVKDMEEVIEDVQEFIDEFRFLDTRMEFINRMK